jgi:hypothetical protein
VPTSKAVYPWHKRGAKIVYIVGSTLLERRSGEMANKRLERTEAEFNEFLQDPAYKPVLQPVLQRHPGADQRQASFFEAIGVDLDSEQEVVREEAFWALKPLIPQIDEDLYVRKKSQKNIIDHLIDELVKKHRFTTKKGKDPRPLVKKIISNWQNDGQKNEDRLVSLDMPITSKHQVTLGALLPSPTVVEDKVLDQLLLKQFRAGLVFLTENEKFVIDAAIKDLPTEEIAEELGITENAVAHLKSRARQKILMHQAYLRSFDAKFYCRQYLDKMDDDIPKVMSIPEINDLGQILHQFLAIFHTKKPHE